ncbi:MAG: CusA/CzcA family heavy metal efflux RND transporter, partial [Acidobacteria bacterium]
MRRLVSVALHQPLYVALLLVLFVAAGVAAFRSLPVEAFPDVTDVQVTVITLFPGHAPEEVEKQVTIPLEIGLSGLPNAVRMFSHTQFGLSYIILTFNDNANDYFARQQVLERLQGIDLPGGVQPELAPMSTAIGEIYRYRVAAKGLSPAELRSIQDWVVARNLKMIPGVADVVSFGGFIKQYEVTVNTARMKSYGVTLQQVFTALGRGNANAGGSFLERGEQQYLIRGIGMLQSSDDLGDIVVAEHGGTPLLIRDIADVTLSAVPRQGIVGQDGDDEIVSGIVLMRKGENPSDVLAAVKDRVAAMNASILPKPVRIVPFYDRTKLIDTTLHTVFKNLLEGALLVAIVLYLFLGNFRAAGIVAVVIPLSLLATFIGLRLRAIPANLLSLGAMDFGIIVDGAVIVLENVFRRLTERREHHRAPKAIVLDAAVEVGRPTLYSMLVIIIAHLPIFTLQRHEGRIFAPMAYTVVSALVGSLLFSLTLVPLLSFFLLRNHAEADDNVIVRMCKRAYRPALRFALERRRMVLGAAVVALVSSLLLVPALGTEFLPELNEGALWINVMLPPGISVTETSRQLARIRGMLRRFPEVVSVLSKAGRPEDGTDPKMINMAEFLVDVRPETEWPPGVTKDRLIERMNASLQTIPGIEPSFSQPIRDNVLESISQIDGQVVVKIFGDDVDVLRGVAKDALRAISGVRGVSRAFVDRAGQVPQLRIAIDRGRAARYGLNVADVEDVIETALGGRTATQLWEGERRFNVVVRLGEEERGDQEAIANVL